ncbi:unnamed protein product [Cuscuta campestris]|uniref:DUF632 domain-containing protein n=1 Tax=Cuscuta campestris TaxID=132261 RepID=A0A484MTJ8_9ASTE|nr:unnamed protein product [Cuscuta campestris]
MGCVVSRTDQEERVQLCKERKRLMKELVGYRKEFANSQLSYLKALKNTGVTLRQFTESDSLDLESVSCDDQALPPSPPSPFLPPPPPPPPFSPDLGKDGDSCWEENELEKSQSGETFDDNSSMMSWFDKDSSDVAMEAAKNNRKTLEGIMRDLDDHFLKASNGATEIAVFIDINVGENSFPWKIKENKGKKGWSSKSLSFSRDSVQHGPNQPCKPGAHCATLDTLYVAEQNLYKELEVERKMMVLQNQNDNSPETENRLQESVESITKISSSILELIDDDLYPQLVALTSGLMEIWKMMCKSHEAQSHISSQLNRVTESLSLDKITESHRLATAQLHAEVSFWYNSFCNLIGSQQEYVRSLCTWIQLTHILAEDHRQSHCWLALRRLCEEWQLGCGKLPDKVVAEAIKSFLMAIQSIIQQQGEEQNQQKRCEKLERRLEKELSSLAEMEDRFEGLTAAASPKHPLSLKRGKVEALKKQVDLEKARHQNLVQSYKAMVLNHLKANLPAVFHALLVFSNASADVFDSILSPTTTSETH